MGMSAEPKQPVDASTDQYECPSCGSSDTEWTDALNDFRMCDECGCEWAVSPCYTPSLDDSMPVTDTEDGFAYYTLDTV